MNTGAPTMEPQAGDPIGRWVVSHAVGRGGMASVYAVRDRDTGELRALKLMNPSQGNPELERRFAREHQTLARLRHLNIPRVFDRGDHDGRPYFVMELVEGEDLRALAERWAAAPPPDRAERARAIVAQVADALAHVHARGLVHRDITPGNVQVMPDGTVRLLDFGVVKDGDAADLTTHGELLGTVAYIAPEQIHGGQVDARADLYALGAVLYYALTGRRPFNARTLAGYLEKHLHRAARPPSELAAEIPADLDRVCLRCLEKEPGDRYASARHLALALRGPGPLPDEVWPPALAGRDHATAAIEAALEGLTQGRGGVLLVDAAPGHGRTRLLGLIRARAQELAIPCLVARARTGRDPLEAYARGYAALRSTGLPASPLLERLFGESDSPGKVGVPPERWSIFAAFREMFVGAAPRVVALDDLHALEDIEVLEYLVRNTVGIAGAPVLWVFTRTTGAERAGADTDGIASGARTGVTPTRITLGALAPVEVEQVVAELLPDGPIVTALARRLHAETDGNPSFVVDVLRTLLADSAIFEDDAGRRTAWTPDEAATTPMPLPRSVRDRMLARIRALPDETRSLAACLAVAERELLVAVAAEVLGVDVGAVHAAAAPLVASGLAVEDSRAGALELCSGRARDLLYDEVPPTTRAELHRRVGIALERHHRRRVHAYADTLASHFQAAGLVAKALPYLLQAATRLLERGFAAEASRTLDRAIALEHEVRGVIPLGEAERVVCEALLRRAEALDHLGRWQETRTDLDRARTLAEDLGNEALASRAAAALGVLARENGDAADAEARFVEALRLADRVADASLRVIPLNGLGGIHWARGDLDNARRWWVESLAVGESTQNERGLGHGWNGLGLVALCRGQSAEARRYFEQSAEVFERIGLLGPLATARVNLVEIHHVTGNLKRGLELSDRTVAAAREMHHLLGMARGRAYRAMVLVDIGRAAAARDDALEALTTVRALGHHEDELSTLIYLARARWALGERAALRDDLDQAEGLLDRYDTEGFTPLVHAWRARLATVDGDTSRAEAALGRATSWAGRCWPYQEARLDLALARATAAMGDRAEATRHAEAAVRKADACGFRLYALKGHRIAAATSDDDATIARHRRVADALARSLAANLAREDAERFLERDAEGAG